MYVHSRLLTTEVASAKPLFPKLTWKDPAHYSRSPVDKRLVNLKWTYHAIFE